MPNGLRTQCLGLFDFLSARLATGTSDARLTWVGRAGYTYLDTASLELQ